MQLVVRSDATYQDIADEEIPPKQLVVPSDAAYQDIARIEENPTNVVGGTFRCCLPGHRG
jgi:hypothetical protein